MITINQIKAGRALLDWKQADLARQAGLSLASIANLEQNKASPRPSTMLAIQQAFENAGIEFTPDPGVRLRREKFHLDVWEGYDSLPKTWLDIEQTLSATGGEVLLSGLNEREWIKNYKADFATMVPRRIGMNITTRHLICEGDNLITTPVDWYRAIPKMLFQQNPYYIYADRVAIISWEPRRVLLIQNSMIADSFRKQFRFNWSIGKKLDPKKVVMAKLGKVTDA